MIEHEELLRQLNYDENTGRFTWLISKKGVYKKTKVGKDESTNEYERIHINRKEYKAHRLAWFYVYKKWPDNYIDHINGDKWDNRISNLRDVTNSVNCQNKRDKIHGVTFHPGGKYVVRLVVNGKMTCLFRHKDKNIAELECLRLRRIHYPGNTI